MRIGLTCTTIENAITHGKMDGIGTYTKNLYETYQQSSCTVVPISFPNTKKPLNSSFNNGCFFNYSYAKSIIASTINPTKKSIHGALKPHMDLLHCTDHMIPRINDIPVIATINDGLMFNKDHHHWKQIRLSHIKQWLRRQSLRWPDYYITISEAMRHELINTLGIDEKKLSVIHLGISPWWFEVVSQTMREHTLSRLQLPKQFLLFTGTLQYKKNLPRLVDAFLQLPISLQKEFPLVVVGRPSWDAKDSLAAIDKLIASQYGYWLNYINIEDLRTLYQCAALHVHPSLHEGFGLTLLEAFASNTPVMTSNVTAMPEIAGGAAYLINPFDVDHIRYGLETLLTTPSLLTELRTKGLTRVKDFSWKKCADETLQLYRQFV